jgi:hypothetical protein
MTDDGKPSATVPTSAKKHNIKLDEAAERQEPIDWDAPWRQRRSWATLWSTMKGAYASLSNLNRNPPLLRRAIQRAPYFQKTGH